jgi:hypothetical protein
LDQIEIPCQFIYKWFLITCIALVTLSCSSNKSEKTKDVKVQTQEAYREIQRPGWLKVPKRFSFKDEYSEYFHHPYFDEIPGTDYDKKILNAVLLTPKDSEHFYTLDLPSGQIIKSFSFCPMKDLLGNVPGTINSPKFSLGLIPRILDPTASPQQVVIFGDVPKDLRPGMVAPITVIGGVYELECSLWPCDKSNGWEKKVILLASFLGDENFTEVRDIERLKERIDWPYFKSFMENSQGVHSGLASPKLGYQIKGQLSGEEALNLVFKDGHIFSSLELFTMRSSCHKIYDYLYDSINKNKDAQTLKRIANFNKNAPENIYKSFKNFLPYFIKNYGDRYFTCNKYVRPSNPFDSAKRHWFFSGFSAFMNLRGLNYFFSCPEASWGRNPFSFENKGLIYDFESEISKCSINQINSAFVDAPNKLESLVKQNVLSYRYLTFDGLSGGTHHKVYGWVPFEGLSPYCKDPKDREVYMKDFQTSFFPLDIRWNFIQ